MSIERRIMNQLRRDEAAKQRIIARAGRYIGTGMDVAEMSAAELAKRVLKRLDMAVPADDETAVDALMAFLAGKEAAARDATNALIGGRERPMAWDQRSGGAQDGASGSSFMDRYLAS